MDVEEMLAAIQQNHNAALEAMTSQIEALRESCALQQLEIKQLKEQRDKEQKQHENEQSMLQRMLDDAERSNEELRSTVAMLNHELQIKSVEQLESSITGTAQEASVNLNQSINPPPHDSAPLLHQQQLPITPNLMATISPTHSNATYPPRSTYAQQVSPTNSRASYPPQSLSDSIFSIPSYRSFETSTVDSYPPLTQTSNTRRRRRESHGNVMSNTPTITSSMDTSYPAIWESVQLTDTPRPPEMQVCNTNSRHSTAPNSRRSQKPLPVMKSTNSSRLEKELKNLREKLKACSRT